MARIEIATLLQRYLQVEKEIQKLEAQLIRLIQTSADYEWLFLKRTDELPNVRVPVILFLDQLLLHEYLLQLLGRVHF